MPVGLMVILVLALQAAPAAFDAQQLKGHVKSVFAERLVTDLDLSERNKARAPWYKEVYDNQGRLTELIIFNGTGSLNNTWLYTYADDNRLSQREVYDSNNLLKWRELHTYDQEGILREVNVSGPDGLSTVRYTFRYDNSDRKIEWVRSEANGREYTKESLQVRFKRATQRRDDLRGSRPLGL